MSESDRPLIDQPGAHEVVASKLQFASGRVIDVRTDEVAMSDGHVFRDVVVHPGAVGIIALDESERVLMLRQYRHPVGRYLWEPPAGLLDVAGEDPVIAAGRELFEEAHLEADTWHVLVDAFTTPGMSDEAIRLYLARNVRLSQRERHAAEAEEIDMPTQWVPLQQAVSAVLAGKLHNPLAIMGLLAAAAHRATGWLDLRPTDAPWPEMSSFTGSTVVS